MTNPLIYPATDHSGASLSGSSFPADHGAAFAYLPSPSGLMHSSSYVVDSRRESVEPSETDYWSQKTDAQLVPTLVKAGGLAPQIGSPNEPLFQPPEQITVQGTASIGYITSGTQITFLNAQNQVIERDTFSGNTMTVAGYVHPKVKDVVDELNEDVTGGTLSAADISSHVSLLTQGGESYALARSAIAHSAPAAGALQSLYQAILGRAADSSGLQTYEDALGRGWALPDVVAALAYSPEAASDLKSMISDVQGRTATDSDNSWITSQQNSLANGQTLANVRTALAHFSGESGVVESVFNNVLGRNATQVEVSSIEDRIGSGYNISQLQQDLASSQEAKNNLSALYQNEHGRLMNEGDYTWAMQQLAGGTTLQSLRVSEAHNAENNQKIFALQFYANNDTGSGSINGLEDKIANGETLLQVRNEQIQQTQTKYGQNTPIVLFDDNGNTVQSQGNTVVWPASLDPKMFVKQGLADSIEYKALGTTDGGGAAQLAYLMGKVSAFKQGGVWDAQRVGGTFNSMYVDYATIAIGLYASALGISQNEILNIENSYAYLFSSYPQGTAMDPIYTNLPERNVINTGIGYELVNDNRITGF
ncbi:DUF4214 domain-containing protein [Acetobacteraceae bacterium KSS8]|uniref:DUF4214 domain-containing protein n=1 Tax=Endosaccharibacter trunci TaxID=2812733 RepID=A0ABT1WBB3_9PROT|nr:DUF4214 domain-containing protein [Acetobacteraceae bacterium KSS8]